jgi:hypothetical protein
MYKQSAYLVPTSFPAYLVSTIHPYMTYFLQNGFTEVKPDINSVEVHPQLSHDGHPVNGSLVSTGSVLPSGTSK